MPRSFSAPAEAARALAGVDVPDANRRVGVQTGRILKGDKAADLPVEQATKVDFNLKTAKTLGITVPLPLLGRADEIIE